ncbi:MAG: anthranilate synthase component I family protein [Bacillota bacterium]
MSSFKSAAGTRTGAGFYFSEPVIRPDYREYATLCRTVDYVAVSADMVIPGLDITYLYEQLAPAGTSALLESLAGSENGRYSIIGYASLCEYESHDPSADYEALLRRFINSNKVPDLGLPHFSGGLIGFFGYDLAMSKQKLVPQKQDQSIPAFSFFMPGVVLVYDRQNGVFRVIVWTKSGDDRQKKYEMATRKITEVLGIASRCVRQDWPQGRARLDAAGLEAGFEAEMSQTEFCSKVRVIKEHIKRGDIFQAVLSRRWCRRSSGDPWQAYLAMRRINPSPYMFYLKMAGLTLAGASPEMQVKVEGDKLHLRPIAGTRKVTGDPVEDERLRRELLNDEKERAEHLMLVDLGRNDVGRVSRPGSVRVRHFMVIEPYSHVVHLVSSIEGRLRPGMDALHAFTACFPAGTLTGAPKRKAMEIIDGLESSVRGPYGGAVGYLDFNGNLDSCITIRTVVHIGEYFYLQTGAGIVADSVPELEDEETLNKARVLMLAIMESEEAIRNDFDDR